MANTKEGNELVLIPLDEIVSVRWSVERGKRLEQLRGGMPQERIAQSLREQGIQISRQYIQKLESGAGVKGVSPQILQGLCKALSVSLPELLGVKSLEVLRLVVD